MYIYTCVFVCGGLQMRELHPQYTPPPSPSEPPSFAERLIIDQLKDYTIYMYSGGLILRFCLGKID